MKVEKVDFEQWRAEHGFCPYFTTGYVECHSRHCDRCEFADRIRVSRAIQERNIPLLTKDNCLRQTTKGGGDIFFRRPVVLSEDALKKYGIRQHLYYQMAFAYDGGGCLPKNTAGPVDVYLFADKERKFTVLRFELLGVPNEQTVKRYDNLFFMGLHRVYK